MKKTLLLIALAVSTLFSVKAQTDRTSLITNPSFETGNLTGWTWTGTNGYAWAGVNTDGDGTKNGSYIAGTWNAAIGDIELGQTITGLPNGHYRVTANLMGSSNATTSRLTTQRLFANGKSQLFGAQDRYAAANLTLLGTTESYSFGGYAETANDAGPFQKLSVVVYITDGTLKLGIRSNGKSSALGYTFPNLTAGNGHGWFKVDNFTLTEVSNVATLDAIKLSAGALNETFSPATFTYTATLPLGTKTVTPTAVVLADGQTVTGDGAIDVSSGTGSSVITVKSIDGTTTHTYTINYTVLALPNDAVASFATDSAGVNFALGLGTMRLQVCNDKIIQVSYALNPSLPAKDDIIVNKAWGKSDFTVAETTDSVTITTQSLIVSVSKATARVSFFDKTGNLILTENKKQISPATVLGINTFTCSATFDSPVTEGLFGLGQHQQKIMDYKTKTLVLDQQNTEIALPFMITTRGYGLLWDNYSLTNFYGNLSANTKYQFSSESGKMVDYYFMYGPEFDQVISLYRTASGSAPMFPKWAYGLFQSKDKYTTTAEILKIANQYRAARLPLDCIVQDWDYWTPDYWGSHTMDATKYPDPKRLIDSLHSINVHTMISIWPVFHNSTNNYKEFNAINALYPSNGNHYFYDPHNDQAKQIYWNQVNTQLFGKYGWDAWWADNDEPQGYPDGFDRKNHLTAKGQGVTYYNTYPIQHTAAVYNGWRQDIPNKRVFTLSRSAFSGQQRYATACWSGDITSDWTAFQKQLSAGLNFCMSGMPYWTTDIGGYIYTDWSTVANQELMVRWFQYGAFCPIFRIHGQGDKALISPSFTPSTKEILAQTDRLRYRLMPYIYSNAWKVTSENYTMMRHLVMDYRTDGNVKSIDNQFMFGPSMMINPVTSAGISKRSVYLPAGKWYDFWTGEQLTGGQTVTADAPLDKIPVFVKAGSIIPMGPQIEYANQAIDPVEIRIYKGENGSFTLYDDEGDTYNYEKGSYAFIPLSYSEATQELTIGPRTGSYKNMPVNRNFKIVWVDVNYGTGLNTPTACDTTVLYNGTQMVIKYNPAFVAPATRYEAENAALTGSAVIAANQTGYSGAGFVAGLNASKKAAVMFTVSVPQTGNYIVKLRYSAAVGAANRTVALHANGTPTAQLACNVTTNWNTWGETPYVVNLTKGQNTISYVADSAAVNLDCIDLAPSTSLPSNLAKRLVCRIRPQNSNWYIDGKDGNMGLAAKDSVTLNQVWAIEKTDSVNFRIVSQATGKCMAVKDASANANAEIVQATIDGLNFQKWMIDDYGYGLHKLTAAHSNHCLEASSTTALVQNPDLNLASQRWIFEDTTQLWVAKKQTVVEHFDYPLNSALNSLGSAGKGWDGPWTVFEGTAADMTVAAERPYTGLKSAGNRLSANLSANAGTRAYRTLNPAWSDDGDSIWISFLLEVTNPTANNNSWQGLSLYNGSTEQLFIGKNWGVDKLGFIASSLNGGIFSSTVSYTAGQAWIVALIKSSGDAANETAYMWINPDPKSKPAIANANVTTSVQINNGFDRVGCHLGQTAGIAASYDEIRLSRTFEAVAAVSTGINRTQNSLGMLSVSPNPVSDKLNIDCHAPTSNNSVIEITDCTGQCVYKSTVQMKEGANHFSIDVKNNGLQPGIYLVQLTTGTDHVAHKFILK